MSMMAPDLLKSYVRRIEAMDDEIKALNDDKSEIYKEARSNGFDVKVLRKVVSERRKDSNDRAEFDAVFDLYWNAVHGLVRAHVENIDEFDAETGEIAPDHKPQHGEFCKFADKAYSCAGCIQADLQAKARVA